MSDDDLLTRSVAEPALFEHLVLAHSQALHAYFARRAGAEADDLLGEAWLAAFRSRATFDARRGSARAWLFGVARHVLFAHLRRPQPVVRAVEADDGEPDDAWDRVDERLAADAARPALREALAALAPGDREMLLLVAWEELTPTEAATTLGIPAGTARSRLHRAREQLRERLGPRDTVGDITTGTRRSS